MITSCTASPTTGITYSVATVRTELQQWKGAAAAWQAALRLSPDATTGTLRAAAVSLEKAGRLDEALPHYARAAAVDPANWQQHYAQAHFLLQRRRAPNRRPLRRAPRRAPRR